VTLSPQADQSDWDVRLATLARPAPLLQSWAWGEVQARSGWRVERLAGQGWMCSLLVKGPAAALEAYVPRGPVAPTRPALEAVVAWAREQGVVGLRVEPESGTELDPLLRDLGFRPAPFVQPQHTLIVPLGSEEEILANCRRGTRYNIRYAEKNGVTVEVGRDAAEMERQARASAGRQGIHLPPRGYYQLLLDTLPDCRTYVARVDGRPVSALLVAHHDGRGYDLYSGSNGERRELKPAYATKWAALKGARAAGCADYDLWGVSPGPDRTHPWYGLWEFKSGFGGSLVGYSGCWELVFDELRHGVGKAATRARRQIGRLLRRGD